MVDIKDWLDTFKYRLEEDIICEKIPECSHSVTELHFIARCMDQIGKTMCKEYKIPHPSQTPQAWLEEVQSLATTARKQE